MIYYNTIDLDRQTGKIKILNEILKCKNVIKVEIERSCSLRGWHIKFWCKIRCLKCRRKYDDPIRFMRDMKYRKPCERNVLFIKKVRYYPDKKIKIIDIKEGYKYLFKEHEGTYKLTSK